MVVRERALSTPESVGMVVRAEWVRGGGLSVHARGRYQRGSDRRRPRSDAWTSSERGDVAGWFDDAGEDAEGYGSPSSDLHSPATDCQGV